MPPNEPRSDEELVEAANAGDASAFEAMYLRYRDWVLRVAYRFTRDRDDAVDVLQETFLYLLRKFPGFRLTSRVTTFLYPAVRNIGLAHRLKRERLSCTRSSNMHDCAAVPGAPPSSNPVSDDLAGILAILTDVQREILLMRFVDDMTPTEIAASLEIPVGTAKSRLHAAIERLRTDPRARRYFDE